LKYQIEAISINQRKGFRIGEAYNLSNIGLIYGDKKEFDKALKSLNDALMIFTEMGSQPQIDILKYNIKFTEEEKKLYVKSTKNAKSNL